MCRAFLVGGEVCVEVRRFAPGLLGFRAGGC